MQNFLPKVSRKAWLQRSRTVTSTEQATPLSPIMRLQKQIGNQATQRFISRMIQREETPAASSGDISFDAEEIEVDPQFLPRAERGNKRYAQNPPLPGWPYRPDLKILWEANQ